MIDQEKIGTKHVKRILADFRAEEADMKKCIGILNMIKFTTLRALFDSLPDDKKAEYMRLYREFDTHITKTCWETTVEETN